MASSLRCLPPRQDFCLAGCGWAWLSLPAASWYSSGGTGVGLIVVRAATEFLHGVLGLPMVICWALALVVPCPESCLGDDVVWLVSVDVDVSMSTVVASEG